MGAFFAKEIIGAAVQIEKNGQTFYGLMAKRATHEAAREAFGDLSNQEEEHLRQLESLTASLEDPPDTWEREEFAMYLAELAESHVFREDGSGERGARGASGDLEAVELGIRFEKDTILFLEELQRLVRSKERPLVEKLLEWDRGHLVRLVRLKWELTGRARSRH